MTESEPNQVVIIGGGPAGLTAAYAISQETSGLHAVVLEKDSVVGGLARTVDYRGYRFDIGGHRFYTKVKAVEKMWREVLPAADFLRRPRLSRIYYQKKLFAYPLRPLNALWSSGLLNSFLILASYLKAQLAPHEPEVTFEHWVKNRFGDRLYQTFFKTYTEKVWGIPCSEISAEWAAQRIQGLSLRSAVKNALGWPPTTGGDGVITSLIESFDYPRLGPGMMWQTVAALVTARGHEVRYDAQVQTIRWAGRRVESVEIAVAGQRERIAGAHFISSMPLRELVEQLVPAVPEVVLQAARRLKYRDFLTVALIIDRRDLFPDNWIYVHDPGVKVGRIQNFKNWSPDMVADPTKTCLGLEYFCFAGDGLWNLADAELVRLGTRELAQLGLARPGDVVDGTVVRMPKAYPVYDATYRESLQVVREFLATLDNLQVVGRNGMHRYNNQDHSMLTAMLAVKNILGGHYDLFKVNAEPEYLEESAVGEPAHQGSTQPRVPMRIRGNRF